MHLLTAQQVTPEDEGGAVDLGQSPGDIVILSAADTELGCIAQAHARLGPDAPTLRLASFLKLGHPMSVDLYVEQIVSRARLVILRLLGGRSYWPYGVEQIADACRAGAIPFAIVPGDDQPDPELASLCTVAEPDAHRIWQYLVHGGPDNSAELLRFAASLIGREASWREPAPLLRAGLYWPELAAPDLEAVQAHWHEGAPVAAIVFYRALLQAADLEPINALIAALGERGMNPLPVFATSLKDPVAAAIVGELIDRTKPRVILNATGFAVSRPGDARSATPFDGADCPVLQVVLSTGSAEGWRTGTRGLSPRDLAMSVALPEVDGRVLTRAVAFKTGGRFDPSTEIHLARYEAVPDRIAFTADLARAWADLAAAPAAERRIAVILANYPNRDGRIANGVGLDTPASTTRLLGAMQVAGYRVDDAPETGNDLIAALLEGPTNAPGQGEKCVRVRLDVDDYLAHFALLPKAVRDTITDRWGAPSADPHVRDGAFDLALLPLGNVVVGIQPTRGYDVDPVASYHDPALPPPHHYLAFYVWLRRSFGAHAIIHMGKHGNLEWLPGKAVALSEACLPEAALGPVPHIYPFIVNDPGEGTQAKRRASAVIIDHLTPPLTRAETYGPLRELESLVDEYYEAAGVDPRRCAWLEGEILATARHLGLDSDIGIARDADSADALARLDNHLCELKELQIRDGLHIFGEAPAAEQMTDLLVALLRVPRGTSDGGDASLIRAIAADLGLDGFDPLDAPMGEPWTGPRPSALATIDDQPWRSQGDTVERLELLAGALVSGSETPHSEWQGTRAVLESLEASIRPAVQESAIRELDGVLTALDGRFVQPGPSGAPTRGRLDVLPTGRNFYSVDSRAVPTRAAWQLGWRSAELLVERYVQERGDWPRAVALSAWGTANMRTGGDDIAQALALLGARPRWDDASGRVTGFEILPAGVLGRPRIDVTLRVSGFFRDAFPAQIDLFDEAVRKVASLDEPDDENFLAAKARTERADLEEAGHPPEEAERRATFRVFGSKPGAYGAGLQALIDERGWETDADLSRAYIAWGGYAYGRRADGAAAHDRFERRLGAVELVLHNQDNREHDILDSDDYYQFEGGITAAVRVLSGQQPEIFHNDHSRPESPRIRTLKEEVGRIVRGRAANPKWLKGVMRHGYKGAFEIAATVDYLFAFASTARIVESHHFDALFDAYVGDPDVRAFIDENNPAALREIAERFLEAIDRDLWRPRSNSALDLLSELRGSAARA